jgi:hypothetical protein
LSAEAYFQQQTNLRGGNDCRRRSRGRQHHENAGGNE